MAKSFYTARFSTPEELAKFLNGEVDIEVQQICHSQHDGWVLFYWKW